MKFITDLDLRPGLALRFKRMGGPASELWRGYLGD